MSGDNPYRDWLKLPSDSIPPNYYQLLQLAPQECTNRSRIVAAAKSQLERLKKYDTVQNRTALKKLVAEIKGAAKCLGDGAARSKYDQSLRQIALAIEGDRRHEKVAPVDDPRSAASNRSPRNHATRDEVPLAIPLAIPVTTPAVPFPVPPTNTIEVDRPASISMDPLTFGRRRDVGRKVKKRNSFWLGWSGGFVLVAAVAFAVFWVRPDMLAMVWRGEQNQGSNVSNARTQAADSSQGTAVESAEPGELLLTLQANPRDNYGAESANVAPQAALMNDRSEANPPPGEENLMVPVESASSSSAPVEPIMSSVTAAESEPMSEGAFNFYVRSIVDALAENDLAGAIELFSRLDPATLTDQQLTTFYRLSTLAGAYGTYRDWLRDSAERIRGGTALEVGKEKLPIAIVEASADFVIFRDRGVNYRYPLDLVPRTAAWAIIEQMRPGEPRMPLFKQVSRYLGNWDQPVVVEQILAEVLSMEDRQADDRTIKETVVEWLQVDSPSIVVRREVKFDLNDARWVEALDQLPTYDTTAPLELDAIHKLIRVAFEEEDLWIRMAGLKFAQRVAIEQGHVRLALCLHMELSQDSNPPIEAEEYGELVEALGMKIKDAVDGARFIAHVLKRFEDPTHPTATVQSQGELRVAADIASRFSLDSYSDALEKATASRK